MSVSPSIRKVVEILALTAAWCALWRTISFANIAAGLLIGTVLAFSGYSTSGRGSVRLGALVRLAGLILVDLAKSTAGVAYEVLTPTDSTDEAVIGVALPPHERDHLLLLTLAITLTPGTAVVDADTDQDIIYVHLLYADQRDEVTAHVLRLADLAHEALPVNTSPAGSSEVAQ